MAIMKSIFKLFVFATLLMFCGNVNAQSLLGKLKDTVKKTVNSVASSDNSKSTEEPTEDSATDEAKKTIQWDQIPVYSAQLCNVTDQNGNLVKNADGTQQVRVFLVDQFGNKRSVEAVQAQHKKLSELTTKITAKIGGGAAVGAVTGLLSGKKAKGAAVGAVAGAAVGTLASIGDIKEVKKIKKSLKQQEELIETYAQNFTSEGEPINASADVTSIKGLDLSSDNALSMSAADIKKAVSDASFTTTDDSAWDIDI